MKDVHDWINVNRMHKRGLKIKQIARQLNMSKIGVCKPRCGPKPMKQNNIDMHYKKMCIEMNDLFQTIGIAV